MAREAAWFGQDEPAGTQMAEYQGKASRQETDQWQSIGGHDTTKEQIEQNLQRGPMLMPKDAPGVDQFLKENPDVKYKDYEDHWLIQPLELPPLVGSRGSTTRVAGRTSQTRSNI